MCSQRVHVHKVQNILLEAAATKPHRRRQELWANARVHSNRLSNHGDIIGTRAYVSIGKAGQTRCHAQKHAHLVRAHRNARRTTVHTARTFDSSCTFAPVASQIADIALIDETRCAKNAFAASFESSDDHVFVIRILSFGTQCSYTADSAAVACWNYVDVGIENGTLT